MKIKWVFMVISLVFFRGWKCIMFKLVGINKVCIYLLNFIIWMLLIDIFVEWCIMLNKFICICRVKCLFIILSVGICLWIILFCEEKLYLRVEVLLFVLFILFFFILFILCNRVLILFWDNKLFIVFYLLLYDKVSK